MYQNGVAAPSRGAVGGAVTANKMESGKRLEVRGAEHVGRFPRDDLTEWAVAAMLKGEGGCHE